MATIPAGAPSDHPPLPPCYAHCYAVLLRTRRADEAIAPGVVEDLHLVSLCGFDFPKKILLLLVVRHLFLIAFCYY